MHTISFPHLGGLTFRMTTNAFYLGNLAIAWYAVIITAGFLLAVFYALRRMKEFGLEEDRAMDAIIGGMIGGLVGARIYYVVFMWDLYKDNLMSVFNTRNGGLAIYGGIIGGLLVGGIVCKLRHIHVLAMFDVAAIGYLIGQCIGRWGNFVNAEAYGSETNSLFGMSIDGATTLVHPCFLYESVWCLIGFLLLHFYSKHRKFDGEILLMYLSWYGLGRMMIEGLRTDSLYWGPFRVSQMLSGLLLITSFIAIIVIRSNIKRNNDPNYLPLYVTTEESKRFLAQAEQLKQASPAERKELKKQFAEEEKAQVKEQKEARALAKKAQKLAMEQHKDEWRGMTDTQRAEAVEQAKQSLSAKTEPVDDGFEEVSAQVSKQPLAEEAVTEEAVTEEAVTEEAVTEEAVTDEAAAEQEDA